MHFTDPSRVVLPDGWAQELGQALAGAFERVPPAQVTVQNTIEMPADDGPTQIDFQRNPNGTIKSATID